MLDVLSNLDNCTPSMWSELFLTVIALNVCLNELSDKSLFDFSLVIQLLLDCHLNLYSFRMLFSPQEPCVHNPGSVQSFNFL